MSGRHALMWSGGKDSALALRRATVAGIHVARLLTFYDSETGRVRFHGTRVAMLEAQADRLGIELRAVGTTWDAMADRLASELRQLHAAGFGGVVFGDIHLGDVRAWYEDRVTTAGLAHVEPIWGESSAGLLREFVDGGGRAVITCVDTDRLSPDWLGRIIDERFVDEIQATGIDPCGENGEYHSFAFDGPPFHGPVGWRAGEVRSDERFRQLDVLPAGASVGGMEAGDGNQNFRDDVVRSLRVDPRPTLENLAKNTGLTYDEVAHHALVRYASSGAEALLAIEPAALRELIEAARAEDWPKVRSIIGWLEAGLTDTGWH